MRAALGSRRRRIWLATAAGLLVAGAAVTAVRLTTSTETAHPASAPGLHVPARDGDDPYHQAGCLKDEQLVDQRPMQWPNGSSYGKVALYYSGACRAAWGYVYGPNSSKWTVYIVAHRDTDHASAPSTESADIVPNSWGNALSTDNGCVYVQAYVKLNDTGASSKPTVTGCFNTTGTITHG